MTWREQRTQASSPRLSIARSQDLAADAFLPALHYFRFVRPPSLLFCRLLEIWSKGPPARGARSFCFWISGKRAHVPNTSVRFVGQQNRSFGTTRASSQFRSFEQGKEHKRTVSRVNALRVWYRFVAPQNKHSTHSAVTPVCRGLWLPKGQLSCNRPLWRGGGGSQTKPRERRRERQTTNSLNYPLLMFVICYRSASPRFRSRCRECTISFFGLGRSPPIQVQDWLLLFLLRIQSAGYFLCLQRRYASLLAPIRGVRTTCSRCC